MYKINGHSIGIGCSVMGVIKCPYTFDLIVNHLICAFSCHMAQTFVVTANFIFVSLISIASLSLVTIAIYTLLCCLLINQWTVVDMILVRSCNIAMNVICTPLWEAVQCVNPCCEICQDHFMGLLSKEN